MKLRSSIFRAAAQAETSPSTSRYVKTRLAKPGRNAYLDETGRTASIGLSQIFGEETQPSRSTPTAVGNAIKTTAKPSHTAIQSSDLNQIRKDHLPRIESKPLPRIRFRVTINRIVVQDAEDHVIHNCHVCPIMNGGLTIARTSVPWSDSLVEWRSVIPAKKAAGSLPPNVPRLRLYGECLTRTGRN